MDCTVKYQLKQLFISQREGEKARSPQGEASLSVRFIDPAGASPEQHFSRRGPDHGTCQKCKFSDPPQDLLSQKSWEQGPEIGVLTKPSGRF